VFVATADAGSHGSNSARARFVCSMNSTRTWLSLVGFGLTLPTLYTLYDGALLTSRSPGRVEEALALISMGILLVATAHHLSFLFALCRRDEARAQEEMSREGRPPSLAVSLIAALSLMTIGFVAISSMAYAIGRLG
jgi:uncharacterized membrane protein YidH (DUF202 family)